MRVWSVLSRPSADGSAGRSLLLRDGFSWGALLVPTIWFLAQGLWALAALHLALSVALAAVLPPALLGVVLLGMQLFLGFEARSLQGWWLGLRGWRMQAVLMARDEEAAFLNLAQYRPDLARLAV